MDLIALHKTDFLLVAYQEYVIDQTLQFQTMEAEEFFAYKRHAKFSPRNLLIIILGVWFHEQFPLNVLLQDDPNVILVDASFPDREEVDQQMFRQSFEQNQIDKRKIRTQRSQPQ